MTDDMAMKLDDAGRALEKLERIVLWGALVFIVTLPGWLVRGLV